MALSYRGDVRPGQMGMETRVRHRWTRIARSEQAVNSKDRNGVGRRRWRRLSHADSEVIIGVSSGIIGRWMARVVKTTATMRWKSRDWAGRLATDVSCRVVLQRGGGGHAS